MDLPHVSAVVSFARLVLFVGVMLTFGIKLDSGLALPIWVSNRIAC